MQPFSIYIRLKARSCFRVFKALPIPIQIAGVGVAAMAGYALVISNIPFSLTSYLYCLTVYLFAGRWLCSCSPHESLHLRILEIPLAPIYLTKYLLLGIPFCLLNPFIGILATVTGGSVLYLSTCIRHLSGFVVPSFFLPQSYSWRSSWRTGGMYVYLFGLFLIGMGLVKGNFNLVRFSLLWTICLPCILSLYQQVDPKPFLSVYKGISYLLRSKTKETVINTSRLSVAPIVLFLLISPSEYSLYLWVIGGLLGNCILLYTYYGRYPSMTQSLFVFLTLCLLLIILMETPVYGITASFLLLPILYYLAYQHLKSIIYVKPTPGDRSAEI